MTQMSDPEGGPSSSNHPSFNGRWAANGIAANSIAARGESRAQESMPDGPQSGTNLVELAVYYGA